MNNTPSFQINDCRALLIPVPSNDTLAEFKRLFDQAVLIQKEYFSDVITVEQRDDKLKVIQQRVDTMTYDLYDINQ